MRSAATFVQRGSRLLIAAIALCAAGSCAPLADTEVASAPDPAQPNIVFILVDDLGWGDVGYHGSEIRTPNIDALAASGTKLERSYVFPICSPTRAALLTGQNPLKFGLDGPIAHEATLPLNLELLPERLKAGGYQTWMVGKWHLGSKEVAALPNARGFDHFYGHLGGFIDYYTHVFFGGLDWQRNGESVREEGHSTALLTKEALSLIETRDRAAPFFLYLAYNAPHTPLQTVSGSRHSYAEVQDPDRRVYAQMVSDLDDHIGIVMAGLKKNGLLESTLVVLVSDNGGAAQLGSSNGTLRGGKSTAYEGGMRTPAIVSWPSKLQGNRTIDDPVFVQSWAPTLLAAAGIAAAEAEFEDAGFWPTILGQDQDTPQVVMGGAGSLAAYEWPYKYIEDQPRGRTNVNTALYNVEADPREQTDLKSKFPDLTAKLAARIRQFKDIPSLAVTGPRPEGQFADETGKPNFNLRMQETRKPWADEALDD